MAVARWIKGCLLLLKCYCNFNYYIDFAHYLNYLINYFFYCYMYVLSICLFFFFLILNQSTEHTCIMCTSDYHSRMFCVHACQNFHDTRKIQFSEFTC